MSQTQLNPQQLEAVTHGTGPLLIIAGAGTGKTKVITERVKWLITQELAKCEEILALTFTEKAAREMEERIDIALPYGYTEMWTLTFHSFCDRILREEAINIGLNPNYKLLTDTDATEILKKHLFSMDLEYYRPLGNPHKFIAGLLTHISRLKDEDISPQAYKKWAASLSRDTEEDKLEAQKYQELAHIYEVYEQLKIKAGVMDFGDLISYTLTLFRQRPNILNKYQKKFRYILVDEYQDTNYAQNQLVILLAGLHRNLTVVADDDQSIYRWRGAAVSNVIQFRQTYPDAKLIVLTQNYRSAQEILDKSYDLIQHNNPDRLEIKEKIAKQLHSARKIKGEKVEFLHADRVENEAEMVVREITKLMSLTSDKVFKMFHREHLEYRDFAILVRANSHAEPFMRTFTRHGIPYQFLGPGQLFHQPEIKDLISYLRILANFTDDTCMFRVLSMDFFAIPARDLASLGNFSKRTNLHLFESCEAVVGKSYLNTLSSQPVPLPELSEETKEKIGKIVEIINHHLSQISKQTAGEILFNFLEQTGMLSAIMKYQLPIDEKKANNIMRFFNKLKTFESTHSEASVQSVVEWIDLSMEIGESPLASDSDWTENNSVNIITIHSAKGLEFPVVFLVNLVSQRFPSTERRETIPVPEALVKEILPSGDYHLQEERRLCYVGMTRACDKLYLTAADYYGEGKRAKKISPFVAEALGEAALSSGETGDIQLSLLDWQKPTLSLPVHSHPHSEETGIPKSVTPVPYLSYSQIQTFLDCPLHYKAKYILKIPTSPSAAASFGTSIHATLKEFYSEFAQNHSPDMIDIYKRNWISSGYLDKKHEELYFKKGHRYLLEYLDTMFDPHILPIKLEESFSAKLGSLKIGGKIDRVDRLSDGRIEIIDYKTSTKSLTPKEADSDLQLSFYALAATLLPIEPFRKRPEEIVLSLYYFDEQKKVSTTRSASQLEVAKEKILEYAHQISISDFSCSGSILCRNCDFKMLCDVHQEAS